MEYFKAAKKVFIWMDVIPLLGQMLFAFQIEGILTKNIQTIILVCGGVRGYESTKVYRRTIF